MTKNSASVLKEYGLTINTKKTLYCHLTYCISINFNIGKICGCNEARDRDKIVFHHHMILSHIFSARRSMGSPTVTSLSPKTSAMVVSSGGTVSSTHLYCTYLTHCNNLKKPRRRMKNVVGYSPRPPPHPSTARLSPVNDDINRLFSFSTIFLGFKPCKAVSETTNH